MEKDLLSVDEGRGKEVARRLVGKSGSGTKQRVKERLGLSSPSHEMAHPRNWRSALVTKMICGQISYFSVECLDEKPDTSARTSRPAGRITSTR